MKVQFPLIIVFCCLSVACSQEPKAGKAKTNGVNPLAWIDTVRFNSNLTHVQRKQVYLVRNNEEDYEKLTDTARIALRFFWWRAFHPYVVVRVENRPEIRDSSGVRKLYEEWFALYKEDISRLNHDCPVEKGDRCFGKPFPFIHQQHVVLLGHNAVPHIIEELGASGFWQMKPVHSAGPPSTDGSSWTLEVFYKGKHKEVTTDMPNEPIKKICLEMVKMSGFEPKPDEIY